MNRPLVLDTDMGTDVDDALALAFAARHPAIDLRAVTTVSGDTVKRARIAAKLLRLAGRDDVEVAAGIGDDRRRWDRPPWMGHEGEGVLDDGEDIPISPRDGVDVLAEISDVGVATVGMQTNLAAAIDKDASVVHRISRLAVMGGVFAAGAPPSRDHNLNVDQQAAVRALNGGVPTLYVPLEVTMRVQLTTVELDRLRGGDALCQALARLVDLWAPILHRRHGLDDEVVAVLHDPLTVGALVEPGLVETERARVTVALHDGCVRTFVDPVAGHEADVVTAADAGGFTRLWLQTVLR